PPIDAHGFLSDTHTTALVGPDGGVDWLCTPQADGPSLFARILDRDIGGTWRVGVVDGHATGQRYEEGTFVLVTSWEGPEGEAEVVDLLACEPSEYPDDLEAGHVLLRQVRVVRGRVRIFCEVDARPDYVRQAPRWSEGDRRWSEEVSGVVLHCGAPLRAAGDRLLGEVELERGESVAWALDYLPDGQSPHHPDDAEELVEWTTTAWRRWGERADYDGPAAEAVHRSALLL